MSKIKAELLKVTGLKEQKDESDQEFRRRLLTAVHALDDKGWESLSEEAQDWFNTAADQKNSKKDIHGFPDDKEEDTPRRRRVAEADDVKPRSSSKEYEPAVGDMVLVKTKRGSEVSGEIVELDKDIIVVKDGKDEEVEMQRSRVESIESIETDDTKDSKDEPKEPKVGDTVTVVTKRGKTVSGELVEQDKDVVVIKDGKEEVEFARDRLESIAVDGGSKEEETTTRRRSSSKDKDGDKDEGKSKKTTKDDNEGVSVTTRMRELILDDVKAERDDISKKLKKEGLTFKDNTMQLVYTEVHRLLKMMTERKMLK